MKDGLKTVKLFSGVVFLNALLAFPILYLVYKHYSPVISLMDTNVFMNMVRDGNGAIEPPFHYRVVTAFMVRMMDFLPGYDITIAFTSDPQVKKDYFHFVILNFFTTVATSGLLFLYLRDKLRPAFAYLGSLLYLFSFYSVLVNIIPMSDATCQLAIISCILAMEKKKPVLFALVFLAGAFAKETLFFVLPAWVVLRSFSDRRKLAYLLAALPAVAAYFAVTRLYPAESTERYYQATYLSHNIFNAFNPGYYDRPMVFHVFLSQLPLLFCMLLFIWLKVFRKSGNLVLNPELLIIPFLIWVGGTTGCGNNTGRLLFLAFPAIIHFEAMIVQAVSLRLGIGGEAPA